VLGVMRFTSLAEAIELVNATGYGLTSGLESLDDREQRQWLAGIRAGNLYINKPTTGAIVLRQPFGGMGRSSFGPGMKAGGPNYVAQLMTFNEVHSGEDEAGGAQIVNEDLAVLYRQLSGGAAGVPGQEAACIRTALVSYDRAAREEFSLQHDHFLLLGEDNFRRYLPFREVRVRIDPGDAYFDIFARAAAARAAGCRVIVSAPRDIFLPGVKLLDDLTHSWAGGIEFIEETDKELARAIRAGEVERVRFSKAGVRTPVLLEAAHETGIHLAAERVSAQGRLELLWYLREQSVSHAYHRYGNLGARAGNARAEPL
jgi:RHH-type proline utilization regulon transcriptional repressor/proline dehydrogenase/delta 1-pyrroline-5-carboxylate dehydrogenase